MRGHLIIADISGYTQFLTEAELDHAHGIVTELLNAIIGEIHAPFRVSSVEGDAVFLYGETPEDMYGQTVLESVESLYAAFRGALETMVLNTTCRCNACANINALGLKIVMHCGEFVRTTVGDREMLTGPDVIAVHRLLKNHVTESTGIADYLMVTQACVDELELERIVATWREHTESYEHIGEVRGYVTSLADVWATLRTRTQNLVAEDGAWVSSSVEIAAPPAIVWDHLIDPLKRADWMAVEGNTVEGDVDGRIGPGTEYHCAHGGGQISVFTVLDSRPNDYITLMSPFLPGSVFRYTHYVLPAGTGAKLVTHGASPTSVDGGAPMPDLAGPENVAIAQRALDLPQGRFVEMVESAAQAVAPV